METQRCLSNLLVTDAAPGPLQDRIPPHSGPDQLTAERGPEARLPPQGAKSFLLKNCIYFSVEILLVNLSGVHITQPALFQAHVSSH